MYFTFITLILDMYVGKLMFYVILGDFKKLMLFKGIYREITFFDLPMSFFST